MKIILYLTAASIGYLAGTMNLAFFLARRRGFDIRSRGSHNAGASNATVTMGLGSGVLVALHNLFKAFLVAFLVRLLLPDLPCAGVLAGAMAVFGHIFPFYLHFRGGKGFAAFMGLILALDWRFFLVIAAAALIITIVTDYIAIATFVTILAFPLYLLLWRMAFLTALIVAAASLLVLIKHLVNIRRVLRGEEIGLRQALIKKSPTA